MPLNIRKYTKGLGVRKEDEEGPTEGAEEGEGRAVHTYGNRFLPTSWNMRNALKAMPVVTVKIEQDLWI